LEEKREGHQDSFFSLDYQGERVVVNSSKSNWHHVRSCCLQGLILGLIQFIIILASQDDGMERILNKSVDDTKLWWWRVVTLLAVRAAIHRYFNNLRKWTDKHLMKTIMASSCIRGGLDWILGKISLLKGWSGIGTGCPGKWSSSLEAFKTCVDVALQDRA